ncbi:MAG: hypothetical protein NTW19_11960 [Planctomycetota bacterium]|nr:hypothetical protein [Planctomycetota bacterium]
MWIEIDPLVRRLALQRDGDVCRGTYGGATIVAGAIGVGSDRVSSRLDALLDHHRPERVVLVGLAGALDPHLRLAEVKRFDWIIDGQGLAADLRGGTPRVAPDDSRPGGASVLVSLPAIADTPARKRELFELHRAAAADMESFHVAAHLVRRGAKLVVLRAVGDTANDAITAASASWVHPDGRSNAPAAALHLLFHPWALPGVLRMARDAKAACAALADATLPFLRAG